MSAADVGQLIAAVAAVVALWYAGSQLRQNRRLASREVAYKYMERLSSLEFVPIIATARYFWVIQSEAPAVTERAKWRTWIEMPLEDKAKILMTINVFEEMGAMFNQGLIDEPTVRRVMSSASLQYWDEARWFVLRAREGEPDAGCEWELMNEALGLPPRRRFGLGEPWDIRGLWGPSAESWGR